MVSMILLLIVISIMIFSFLSIPFLSSIGGYTVNMLLGWYSPFFYLFVIYLLLKKMFKEKIKFPKWVKLNNITYWIVVISIVFIATSTGYYQSKSGFASIGSKPWHAVNEWFDSFTDNQTVSAWTPKNVNGGFIGVFLYSLIASMVSGIGAFIVALLTLALSVSFIITGSSIGFYKNLVSKKRTTLKNKEIINKKQSNIEQFSTKEDIEPIKVKVIEQPKKEVENKPLPFDDPFAN